METSRPRIPAGATSEMYIGERFEASPIAVPPKIRQRTKQTKFGARALPIDVAMKITAEIVRQPFAPEAIAQCAALMAPNRQPTRRSYWPSQLVIGNEGNGVPEDLAARADGTITIPCPGPVESLNAAVAASVLLYEASRQRGVR